MRIHVFKARHQYERKWKEVRATNIEEAEAIAAVALRCDVADLVVVYDRSITTAPLPANLRELAQALRSQSCCG